MRNNYDDIKDLIEYLKATNDRKYIKLAKHLVVIGGLLKARHLLLCEINLHEVHGGPEGGDRYERQDLKRLNRMLDFRFFRYKGIRTLVYCDIYKLRRKLFNCGIEITSPASEIAAFFDSCEELYFVHKIGNQKKIR